MPELSAPPLALAKTFYPPGCGRIFSLFSRVVQVGLFVTVAIANKTARTAWALLAKGEDYKAVPAI